MWKTSQSNPKYEVSDLGEIRTIKTKRIRKQSPIKRTGYSKVTTRIGDKVRTLLVHREVATLYVPNPFNKPEVNHIDGNKQNNQASNLEWVTPQENMIHAYATGLMPSSKTSLTTHSSRKLTVAIANNLRSDFSAGMSKEAIKSKYGISISSINKCLKGDTY